MNQKVIIPTVITLAFTSQLVTAGSITDVYATGDTLTATKMDNIKTAVNDNDKKISANTENISAQFSGDGSAGNLIISASTSWTITPPTNPYFNDIIIDSGQTLTVPAGTIIRCSGSFINNGTLAVVSGARGSANGWSSSSPSSSGPQAVAHPGDSFGAPIIGAFDNNAAVDPVTLNGGKGGIGIPKSFTKLSFGQFRMGGGAGAGAIGVAGGGGLVKIYCNEPIINNGTINANGDNAIITVGGGAGGIVILLSNTLVDNTLGTISVIGGSGGNDSTIHGASGGGGGGIVMMMSPSSPIPGATILTGGAPGTAINTQSSKGRLAGSGGGASGGNGGSGGSTSSIGVNEAAGSGGIGYVITTTGSPIFMYR